MARTAQVQRDARIGEAEARMQSKMAEAKAEMERMEARLANDTEIARAKRDFDTKKASYDVRKITTQFKDVCFIRNTTLSYMCAVQWF